MGDNPSNHHYAGLQLHHNTHPVLNHLNHSNITNNTAPEEEEGIIKCVCGSPEDDGFTTECEQCNTWQHVECYYGAGRQPPEVHQCVDCNPRIVDRQKRDHARHDIDDRKPRRNGQKSHKKTKTKEHATLAHAHTNGYSQHETNGDSAGNEYTPPLKRAKTHHRISQATTETDSAYHQSNNHVLTPVSQSPFKPTGLDRRPQVISPTLLRAYHDHETFEPSTYSDSGGYAGTQVIPTLSSWLRWLKENDNEWNPRRIDEMTLAQAPSVRKVIRNDNSSQADSMESVQLIATRSFAPNELVGQIIGEVGLRKDYKAESANQWDRLRHPDHFVMFHPRLEIYFDCRRSGSIMRFARRGCGENVKVETVTTGEGTVDNTYFYLTALCAIQEGEEIVLGWKPLDEHLSKCLRAIYDADNTGTRAEPEQHEYVLGWTSTVLSHFGGCACDSKLDAKCTIRSQQNRSLQALRHRGLARPPAQKQHTHRSPIKVDGEHDHHPDKRPSPHRPISVEHETNGSSARSSRSRDSRDPTPSSRGNNETPNGVITEFSARDKKKLEDRMRVVEKQKKEEQKAQSKKKRRSGSQPGTPTTLLPKQPQALRGSALSPSAPSPPPNREETADVGNPPEDVVMDDPQRQGAPLPATGEEHSEAEARRIRSTAQYADVGIQTMPPSVSSPITHGIETPPRPFVSLSKRLLQRNHLRRVSVVKEASSEPQTYIPTIQADLPPRESIGAEPYANSSGGMSLSDASKSQSVELHGPSLPAAESSSTSYSPPGPTVLDIIASVNNDASHHQQLEQQPPGREESSDVATLLQPPQVDAVEQEPPRKQRPPDMHVELPRAAFSHPSPAPTTGDFVTSPLSETIASPSSNAAQTLFAAPFAPMSMSGSLPLPGSDAPVRPSPAKKRMSLAEYTNRRQSKTPATERRDSFGFPDVRGIKRQASSQSIDGDALRGDGPNDDGPKSP